MEDVVDFEEDLSGCDNSDLFDCEWDSIDSVINAVVVFTGVKKDVQTENGLGTLIAFGEGASRSAFITHSKRIVDVVSNPKRSFPFRAIIKVVRFGTNTGFKFFPPNSPITQEDRENFDYYKKNKNRRYR